MAEMFNRLKLLLCDTSRLQEADQPCCRSSEDLRVAVRMMPHVITNLENAIPSVDVLRNCLVNIRDSLSIHSQDAEDGLIFVAVLIYHDTSPLEESFTWWIFLTLLFSSSKATNPACQLG